MIKGFQLVAGNLALNFANTLDFRYDTERRIDLLTTYARLLEFFRQTGVITPSQMRRLFANTSEADARRTLKQAILLRETIYFLLLSAAKNRRTNQAYLRTFNGFLKGMRVPDKVAWRKRVLTRTYGDLTASPSGPLWSIIDAAANLLTSPDCHRVRECKEEACRWLFLDHSKNGSRRWCDMRLCGNRVKARRFYARSRKRV